MPKYSIIIPTYNPNINYFKECINSITIQDYKDYELIIVLNGKKNDSHAFIVNTYSKVQNIKIIYSPKKGISAARNYGLDNAKGKYIIFVDDDDKYIDEHFLKSVNKYIANKDIVFFYHLLNETNDNNAINCITLREEDIKCVFQNNNNYGIDNRSVWNKVFNKHLIDKYNIRFNENITNGGEDALFSLSYALKSKNGCLLNFAPYYHRIHKSSTTYKYNNNAINEYSYFSLTYLNILKDNNAPIFAAYYNFCDYIINHIFLIQISNINNNQSFFNRAKLIKTLYKKEIVTESVKNVHIKHMSTVAKKIILLLLKIKSKYLLLFLFDFKYRKD